MKGNPHPLTAAPFPHPLDNSRPLPEGEALTWQFVHRGDFFFAAAVFFLRHADDGGQRVAFVEAHDPHALRVAADDADVADGDALDLAAGGHHQQLVVVVDADDADHRAVALGGLDVAEALAAAALRAVAEGGGRAFGFVVFGARDLRRSRGLPRLVVFASPGRRSSSPASAFGPNGVRLP